MNPLIPINAIQMRYTSHQFLSLSMMKKITIVDEECVREGTNVLHVMYRSCKQGQATSILSLEI